MRRAKKVLLPAAWPLLCAGLALLFASTASPLYATNFWTDTNIYFTIGRGMLKGLMPYRDLFDHKGPLLYALYALAAAVDAHGFAGVWLLEILSLSLLLGLAQRLSGRLGAGTLRFAAAPLCAMATCCSAAFTQGGSAEEFCLPALMLGILCTVQLTEEKGERRRTAVLFGAAAAWVFLIKYTDCGLFFGLGFFALLQLWRKDGLRASAGALVRMAAGFLVPVLLCAAWLFACGALSDCVRVYFLSNLLDYGGAPMSLRAHLLNALAYLRTQSAANPVLAGLTAAGMAGFTVRALLRGGRSCLAAALAFPAGAGLLLLFCYWGEMAHPYYALVFAATAAAGAACLPAALIRVPGAVTGRRAALLAGALAIAVLPACRAFCRAVPLAGVRREEMPQVRFAGEMRALSAAPTLLDLTSLDQGFYLAADLIPGCRYFADNNLDSQEKREAIDGYLSEGRCEFVVTWWRQLPDNYEPVDRQTGVFDLNDQRTYTLWRRKE